MPTTIDSLNDDVICHVLSFLPTKVSASTSILAKRWRFLWAHLPNFDFKGDGHNDAIKDPDIINRVIALHRDKTINTLSISGDMEYTSPDQLPSWITQAVNSGVRNLYLNFYFDNEFITVLPKCLLTCKTLVDFQLFHCRGITPSCGQVFWPSLKKLSLNHIMFEDNESLPHMLSGCPVLQDLIIEGCYDWGCVFVSSLTIKKLDVQLVCGCCYRYGSVLKINAPSLEYLNVRNYCPENVMILGTMTSLIKADLNLIIGNLVWHDEQDIKESLIARRFLHCLCNVKCLKISMLGDDKLVEIAGLDSRVRFNNLTKLKIIIFLDFHELVKFLEAADNLQLLIFTMDGMHKTYREPKLVPTCMLSCLKTVRIKSWDGGLNKNDFETIKYVLRNAQVLERLEIPRVFSIQNSDKEKLEMLERGSESCQLVFY